MLKKFAFTLSEILLVLSVIGVIAALTIPTLISNIQDQQFKTGYRKVFSLASQVINMANINNELEFAGGDCGYSANRNNFNAMKAKFNVLKECGLSYQDCWDTTGEKYHNTMPTSGSTAFIDASGVAWVSLQDCGAFIVDLNAQKPPNKYGRDRFPFYWESLMVGGNVPTKPVLYGDYQSPSTHACPSGSCWYTSWITGAK